MGFGHDFKWCFQDKEGLEKVHAGEVLILTPTSTALKRRLSLKPKNNSSEELNLSQFVFEAKLQTLQKKVLFVTNPFSTMDSLSNTSTADGASNNNGDVFTSGKKYDHLVRMIMLGESKVWNHNCSLFKSKVVFGISHRNY